MNQPTSPAPLTLVVSEAARLMLTRAQFVLELLELRRVAQEEILGLGGIGKPESLPAVKILEARLRDLDEALGMLRYGLVADLDA